MDPNIQLWFAVFGVCFGMFILGFIWGYIAGRNSKIFGAMNLVPIQRLPEIEQSDRKIS